MISQSKQKKQARKRININNEGEEVSKKYKLKHAVGVFRIQLAKNRLLFSQKNSILDLRLGSKYASDVRKLSRCYEEK